MSVCDQVADRLTWCSHTSPMTAGTQQTYLPVSVEEQTGHDVCGHNGTGLASSWKASTET